MSLLCIYVIIKMRDVRWLLVLLGVVGQSFEKFEGPGTGVNVSGFHEPKFHVERTKNYLKFRDIICKFYFSIVIIC